MNREILFRGKSIKDDKWIYGSFVNELTAIRPINDGTIAPMWKVHTETVGQYIGRTDENGNKIFEGDILKCHYETCRKQWDENFVVIYFCGAFGLKTFDDKHFIIFSNSTHRYCEIIGNIHDNPELLADKK